MRVTEMQDIRHELESQGFDDEFIRDVIKARIGIATAKIERKAALTKAHKQLARAEARIARRNASLTHRSCPQERADLVAQETAPARGLIMAGSY